MYYLERIDVLLCVSAAVPTACNQIGQFVNNDVKWTLRLQRLIKVKLKQRHM